MKEPRWVPRVAIDSLHLDQIREHGGLPGIRDENGLEAALARPRQIWTYEPKASLLSLAAALGFSLAKNHPYRDGNKRIAFLAVAIFLSLNGLEIETSEDDVVHTMLELAAGRLSERELEEWLAKVTSPAE